MAPQSQTKPSFSPYRKWGVGLQVFVFILIVLSVVLMVNYLSQAYFVRFHLSASTRNPLSPRTLKVLESLTNQVKVIIYYDKEDSLYNEVSELVNEYKLASTKISVQVVDYTRDQATALQLKEKYPAILGSPNAKNLVLFDCAGKVKVVEGNLLARYVLEQVPNEKEPEFRRKPTDFMGELMFTTALLNVSNPTPLKAYFLQDDGEHDITGDEKDAASYLQFAYILAQNYILPNKLSLGTNAIPMDCNLLIIAGPTSRLPETTLQKVDQYLDQGGRLFALFNFTTTNHETGLEKILAKWGVNVGTNWIKDPDNFTQANFSDMIVANFGKHALVNPLLRKRLQLLMPRSIGKLAAAPVPGAPRVEELVFSGPRSFADGNPALGSHPFPLMVAVEKDPIKGVITERGTTRMVIAGDSFFLGNHFIEVIGNQLFAHCVANWLLDRTQLLQDIGPRPVKEYRLAMTRAQLQSAQWILLAGMPGSALLAGFLVWLRRRR
ncbi:MAG TPA: GldG family protein [Candidatus Binatia bacterium]|jgi:ABC-2 type transport system permease protein|nr:GldG family protein [Candidatus Binatia bacterium]